MAPVSEKKTFNGRSGMMEVEGARVQWGRSVQQRRLHYTMMISDGDSNTFSELSKLKPYGGKFLITKEGVNKPHGQAGWHFSSESRLRQQQ